MAKIDTPTARRDLKVQRNPHWHKVRVNRFIGFRKLDAKRPGTWIAKAIVNGKDCRERFDTLEQFPEDERFNRALERANKWFAAMDRQVVEDVSLANYTIHHAINAYLKAILANKTRVKSADPQAKHDYTQRRFDLLVMPFVLPRDAAAGKSNPNPQWVHRPLVDLTKQDFKAWREWMEARPTDPNRSGRTRHGKKRSVATVNRDLSSLRAALNWAHSEHDQIPANWTQALKQDHSEPQFKRVAAWKIISIEDRQKLVASAERLVPEFVPFLVAHCIVPVRCGAFSHMTIAAYDPADNTLEVGRDKANGGRKMALPNEQRKHFIAATKDKLPGAFLFTRANGEKWTNGTWRTAFNKCRDDAGLDKRLTVYCLRHSRITDLVLAGHAPMAIAALAGTSVTMIEKHYFQVGADHQRKVLSVPGL